MKNENQFIPFQIQAELTKVTTLAKGAIKMEFRSQESQTTEARAKLMAGVEKVGWMWFGAEIVKAEDIIKLPKIQSDDMYENLSKSQRMKNKLFKFFKRYNEAHERHFSDRKEESDAFQTFYNKQMDKMIDLWEEKCEAIEGGEEL